MKKKEMEGIKKEIKKEIFNDLEKYNFMVETKYEKNDEFGQLLFFIIAAILTLFELAFYKNHLPVDPSGFVLLGIILMLIINFVLNYFLCWAIFKLSTKKRFVNINMTDELEK